MKILFLSHFFYPHVGGVEKHVYEISKELLKKGNSVIVITEKIDEFSKEHEYIDGIEVYRNVLHNDDFSQKFRIWWWFLKHASLIQAADIVHAHDVFFWMFPYRFLYPFKKVYTTFHGYETKYPPSKKAVLIRKISEKLSTGTICVGDYIKKWYGTMPDYVTYGGTGKVKSLKLKVKSLPKKNKRLRIVFIGRLEKDTGIDVYLETLKKLIDKNVQFSMDFVGGGLLEDECKKYGKVYGFVKNPQELLRNAEIVFASSYLSILDALALGKIVIAVFNNPLKEDYFKMSPFVSHILIVSSTEEVIKIMDSIKKEPWKFNTMVIQGQKWASLQTWEMVANIYLKLWKV